jgi:hypothetical protein
LAVLEEVVELIANRGMGILIVARGYVTPSVTKASRLSEVKKRTLWKVTIDVAGSVDDSWLVPKSPSMTARRWDCESFCTVINLLVDVETLG